MKHGFQIGNRRAGNTPDVTKSSRLLSSRPSLSWPRNRQKKGSRTGFPQKSVFSKRTQAEAALEMGQPHANSNPGIMVPLREAGEAGGCSAARNSLPVISVKRYL